MTTLKGAAIGFLSILLWPIAFIVVAVCAILRLRYPRWADTIDDPYVRDGVGAHRGQYEPTVRAVYERYGRVIGDIYWLGFRNTLYGFLMGFKPSELTPQYDYKIGYYNYSHLQDGMRYRSIGRWITVYTVVDYSAIVVWPPGPFWAVFGWKVDTMVKDPTGIRHPTNAEGRPVFSVRSKRLR
jgi:hypothetical protein